MASPWFWLAVWVAGVAASVAAHEAAHVVVAVRRNWRFGGVFFHPRSLGVGVNLAPRTPGDERHLWKIALAGPLASLFAAEMFWALSTRPGGAGVTFASLMVLNLVIVGINLVPTPITDGGHIVKGLTGWTVRWRYVLGLWLATELLALALVSDTLWP
jgi:Zn-dependent protease